MNEVTDLTIFETVKDKTTQRFAPSAQYSAEESMEIDEALALEFSKIPDKMAFKIGEVAEFIGVKPYVLRFWESEFKHLKPQKSKHNQRVYTRKDVETVLMIKKLLYRDRFSIEGAKTALRKLKKEAKTVSTISHAVSDYEKLRDKVHDLIGQIHSLRAKLEI